MLFDLDLIKKIYSAFPERVEAARKLLQRPMTLSEKILYAHLWDHASVTSFKRGEDYVNFSPDRTAMQDATAQMALLQFMTAGKDQVAVPSTVHCDHLITAESGAAADVSTAMNSNNEVFHFLQSVSARYGIGFWKPGAGIIHQVILENYAFPGGMMIGSDSHTVNAGGLGMIAIGVGGADVMDVMAGMPWELRMPKLLGVKLTGKLSGWVSPKDVILYITGLLTVKGGTGYILEYIGEGASAISATGKGTICNMGAEIGATTSVFGYDTKMSEYLRATGRAEVASLADSIASCLQPDQEVVDDPGKYYDKVIEIDLGKLEPYVNGPFTPDAAIPVSKVAEVVREKNYPPTLEVGLIGSCTNSSYEDLTRAASVARQAGRQHLNVKARFIVTPGSELIKYTTTRDGILGEFEKIGGEIMANACGPCIGQWNRKAEDNERPNSILTSFNRNFAKRNDGNPNTHSFVASPEIVTAYVLTGDLTINPLTDFIKTDDGRMVRLEEPVGIELPLNGFDVVDPGYLAPPENGRSVEVSINPSSNRLQRLEPFPAWNGQDIKQLPLLIKAKGKCTTDHISMAGPWLRFRGHLDNISDNMLIGAINYFNGMANLVKNQISGELAAVPATARAYKAAGIGSIVVGDENYGEGSSREHAAMEPRHLGVKAILVKSFARIHETNLKKQGMLALTFSNPDDYDKILEDDRIDINGLTEFAPGQSLTLVLHHVDGTSESFLVNHSYNQSQIEWFKAGGALNLIRSRKL